jgi:hypothetical protein
MAGNSRVARISDSPAVARTGRRQSKYCSRQRTQRLIGAAVTRISQLSGLFDIESMRSRLELRGHQSVPQRMQRVWREQTNVRFDRSNACAMPTR